MRRFILKEAKVDFPNHKVGVIYNEDQRAVIWERTVGELVDWQPECWQEVFGEEPDKLLHQTDLGYYSGLFLQGLISANQYPDVEMCIKKAKELIKKLKEECQNQ